MPGRDEMKGQMRRAVGAGKETAGKATGNRRMEASGRSDRAKGKVQSKVGEAKQKVRDVSRKARGK